MTDKLQIDLAPFVCEAFASNKGVYPLINKLYEQNKLKYYQAAKSSPWYNHEILTCQSIEKEIVMKRALPLIMEGDADKLLQIVRKGWKSLYNAINAQGDIVNLSRVLCKVLPVDNANLDKYTNDQLNAHATISLLLARLLGKDIDTADPAYDTVTNYYHMQLQWSQGAYRFAYSTLPADTKAKIRALKDRIYAEYGISRYWVSYTDPAVSQDISQYTEGLSFLLDTEKLSASIIEDETLSERDIEEILAAYHVVTGNLSKSEAARFLAAGHIIKSLLRAYKRLKEQYFKNNKETLYLDLDTAQQEARRAGLEVKRQEWVITQKNKEIESLQRQVKAEYGRATAEYREQIKAALSEADELRQQIARLKAENEELKTALFAPPEEPEKALTPVDLSQYRGVIVGGHERWQTKMKEILPDTWRFIHPDKDYDLGIVSAADIVFFYTGYLNHATYYPVIVEARRRGIKVCFLRRQNDTDCLEDIQKGISKAGE